MLEPLHLLEQAERLLSPPEGDDRARLTDRCRAVSATYYAVFHAGLIAAADLFAGEGERGTPLYSLAYRSVDHAKMKSLCREVIQRIPSSKYRQYVPISGWGPHIVDYAESFVTLNDQRMLADYDPAHILLGSEVEGYIRIARSAIQRLQTANDESRRAFLTLLLFPPR